MFRGHYPPSNHNTAPDPSGQPHAPSGGGIYRMPPVASGYAPGTRFGSAQSSLHQPQMQDYSYNSNSPHRMYYESEYPLPSNGNEYGQYGQHLAYAAEDQYHAHDGMMPLGDSNPVFEMTQDFPDLASKQDFPALGETVQEPRRNDIKPIEISRQYSSQSRTNSNSRWRHDASSDEFPPIEQSGKVGYSPAVIGKRFNAESMNSNPLNNKSNYPSKSNQPLSLSPDPRATPVNNIQNAPLSTAVANLRIEDTSSSDGRVLESQDTSVYGLKGLLKIIRMADPDLNTLALGTDLTTLGLDLNSTDVLYPSFTSPFSDSAMTREPEYKLPECYFKHPPALKTSHLSKFSLETLFYIFYSMPRDTLQVFAAKELYARDWKYHKRLQLWFTHPEDAVMLSLGYQPNSLVYFDTEIWERRVYLSDPSNLVFMSKDEVQAI